MGNAYHYQHTFRDDLADEFSSVLSVLYDPLEIAGLAAWYDGSQLDSLTIANEQVAIWNDLSGNGHHLGPVAGEGLPSISANLQNGRHGIFFDYAASEMMESSYVATGTGSQSAFIVAKRIDANSEYGGGSVYKSLLSIGRPDGSTTETGKLNIVEDRDSGDARSNAHKVSANNSSNGLMRDGKAHIITTILDYPAFALEGRADALREELDERTEVALADELTPLQIGGSTSASSRRFWGTIYEVLLFNRALASTEIKTIETYLSTKWAIPLQS